MPGRVLLAYLSRAGENYHFGGRTDLQVGNTEVLARTIADRLGCELHRIEAAVPYPRYTEACRGASLAEGLAVQGEMVTGADQAVDSWIRRTGLIRT